MITREDKGEQSIPTALFYRTEEWTIYGWKPLGLAWSAPAKLLCGAIGGAVCA